MSAGNPSTARFPLTGKRVWVAGHNGLAGSAIVARLADTGCHILTVERSELDLLRQADVEAWIARARPDVVIIAAAKVGGILANSKSPAEFLYQNMMTAANIIHAAHDSGVDRLVHLGSSCIYPRDAPQPIMETALMSGPLEPTNDAYAIAKIATLKLAQAYARQYGRHYIGLLPCSLYGSNDNFDLQSSHVLPALVRKFCDAVRHDHAQVNVWGSGRPLREFMHADDLADAVTFLTETYDADEFINVGTGREISIADLATLVAEITGFRGRIIFDRSHLDGTPRKILDVARLKALGWQPRIGLREGIRHVHDTWIASLDGVPSTGSERRSRAVGAG